MKTISLPSSAILASKFNFISKEEIKYQKKNNEYKTERGFLNSLSRLNSDYQARAEMPDVLTLEIEIEWRKSNTWGFCPVASMRWKDANGWHYEERAAYASGCGYDKESTVVAKCCNKVLSGMLWRKKNTRKNIPYGISLANTFFPRFDGGVGMSCYYRIASFLGGKLEHVASGKTYDKYIFTFGKKGGAK
jgi:hypothetical protein